MSRKYVPSLIIVSTSFLGFWIPSNCYPARVTLIVTSLLSLITQQVQTVHIYASYIISIHIWNNICTTFVFLGLIEFILATCWDNSRTHRHIKKDGSMIVTRGIKEMEEVANNHPDSTVICASSASSSSSTRPITFFDKLIFGFINFGRNTNQVDAYSKIIFPISYIIVALMYCLWVASMKDFDARYIRRPQN